MNNRAHTLSREYAATLRRYLVRQREGLLQQAYELGRKAIASGLGVLDMARIHQRALASCMLRARSTERKSRRLQAAESFFLETFSPFEATHRGFRKANLELRQVNAELERRNLELARLNGDLRNLSTQILQVQEEERRRISRELHDEVGQALTAISTNLTMLQRNGTVETQRLRKRIVDAQSLLGQTMETVHRFARELRPAILDELGLIPALRSYLKEFTERTGLRARFDGNLEAEKLNDDQKTVVFRVAQESLTNVARHAQARHVAVSVRRLAKSIQVQIKDDGKSFPVDAHLSAKGKSRLGLVGMQERVRLVNGSFAVESAPGKGTAVRVEIPFKPGGERGAYAKNKRAVG